MQLVPWLVRLVSSSLDQASGLKSELQEAEQRIAIFRETTYNRIAQLEAKIEQDKGLLSTLKDNYKVKLDILEKEKQAIVGKTQTFSKGLEQLQCQLAQRDQAVINLRNDLDKAYQEIGELQSQLH